MIAKKAANSQQITVCRLTDWRVSFYRHTTMQYYDQLHSWVVYRRLPNCQNVAIARFRRRNDAEMYVITVRRLIPKAIFLVAFTPIN